MATKPMKKAAAKAAKKPAAKPAAKSAAAKPAPKKPAATLAAAKKPAVKSAAKKPAAKSAAAKPAATTPATSQAPARTYGTRADKGAPIETYVARLSGDQRAIADQLVSIIANALPGATSELKWGMPVWSVGGQMLAYFRAQKHDVRFGLAYVTGLALPDPEGRLEGTGSDGKHVKLTSPAQIDPARFAEWLKTAAAARV